MEGRTDKQQIFIEYRAKGISFERIAKELGVSKRTLIDWAKMFDTEIGKYADLEAEALLHKYHMAKLDQLKSYGEQLQKIRKELGRRNYSDVPTHKLVDMFLRITEITNGNDVVKATPKPQFTDLVKHVVVLPARPDDPQLLN